MAVYERDFGFRNPYQVLLTADFLEAARGFSIDVISGIQKAVQNDIKCLISQCSMKVLYDAKSECITLAKRMERRRCGHIEKAEPEQECLEQCIGSRNKNRYIVCTQDAALRSKLRDIPGVPLFYLNRSVLIMEPMSPATTVTKETREREKVGLSREEASAIGARRRVTTRPRGKKVKQPNPLSVKKSIKKKGQD